MQSSKVTAKQYPLLSGRERLSLWQTLKGLWKHRKPDPTQELKKIRRELNRKVS